MNNLVQLVIWKGFIRIEIIRQSYKGINSD
jgi:hypothetical protein